MFIRAFLKIFKYLPKTHRTYHIYSINSLGEINL